MAIRYRCRHCNWTHEQWNPSDPRHLEIHHIKHLSDGGSNMEENLETISNVCHDDAHRKD